MSHSEGKKSENRRNIVLYQYVYVSICFQIQSQNSPFSRGVCHSAVEVLYSSFYSFN